MRKRDCKEIESERILQIITFHHFPPLLLRQKQVCTNNDAAFPCNFLFNIFFILWMSSVSIVQIDFAIDFAIFTIWLLTYIWMDGQTDGQSNGQTDRIIGGQTNEWMDMQYACIAMQKTMIFQQILRFLQKHYRRTDGRTD